MTACIGCETPHVKVIVISICFRDNIKFTSVDLNVYIELTETVTQTTIHNILQQLVVHFN